MIENEFDLDNIDLSTGVDKFKFSIQENTSSEIMQSELCCRLSVINRLCQSTYDGWKKPHSKIPLIPRFFGRIVNYEISYDLFVKFGEICKELVTTIEETEITRETSNFFWDSIVGQKRFFHISANDWVRKAAFFTTQSNIQSFVEVRETLMEKPPEITTFHAGYKRRRPEVTES